MPNFTRIEKKWQKAWEKKKAFSVKANPKKKKFYVLEMFPYPSGEGLHMGHAFNYTIGDIYARFKRMNGFNVLYPMGYDSFGLPAENAAIQRKIHPKKFTNDAINNFVRQQKELGFSYDWNRKVSTCEPEYYKWNQYIFLQFLKKGLAYRKESSVNWCPKCNTVLANEQVHNGKCWRHKNTEVEIKQLEQWFIKTTKYANELLRDVDKLKWPNRIKAMQKNWIGKSYGTEIKFKIKGKVWPVFTTRPDTLFGVTFMVVSAQHPKLEELVTDNQKNSVGKFLKKIKSTSKADALEKEGAFTGSYAIHPLTNEKIPIYTGNFVVAEYGSGIVMAVPAHDQRDYDFAKKYKIPIKQIIKGGNLKNRAYVGRGNLVNSSKFNGVNNEKAKESITNELIKRKLGKRTVQFKLRDWLISRQRYWGTPIPIIYCDSCGVVPVPEKDLPVKLPDKVVFGKGNPLESNKGFVNAKCPKCKSAARRETDTMDTFFDSSWYQLRYLDNKNKKAPFNKNKSNYWMPVDQYIGGAEHATMHLIYARFFSKALRDMGFIKINEPFTSLFSQGLIHSSDGHVMSKSRGNVMDPSSVAKKTGADTLRFFLVSNASPDKDFNWSDKGVEGSLRFVNKVFDFFSKVKVGKSSKRVESKINKTIKEVTEDIENFRYNFAIINLRSLLNSFEDEISKKDLESFIKILHPFCPHITEELWEKMGNKNFVSLQSWPSYDSKKIDKKLELAEKAVEKTVSDVMKILKIIKSKGGKGNKVYLYVIPSELNIYDSKELSNRVGKKVQVFASNDSKKIDPEGKAKKARPGKPGIYVE